ncbi:hypothetical protein NDU88_004524 [Pleurodeles waltl]|uniref:Uncharacterized protein n=1 Tax=Pleurodeles waltl TaxID=8319 RepID=A0AAV7PGC1_PLEWA|nr:hypothetical protein NDU88_004524 [Pleurodeles waltl]
MAGNSVAAPAPERNCGTDRLRPVALQIGAAGAPYEPFAKACTVGAHPQLPNGVEAEEDSAMHGHRLEDSGLDGQKPTTPKQQRARKIPRKKELGTQRPALDLEQIIAERHQALKEGAALMATPQCSSPEMEKLQTSDEEMSVAAWPSGNDSLHTTDVALQTADTII